ncbi:hypothetical protein DL770_002798 [Monosporascus sp. CRB-9-2]|nr:hypothetical protein DL770_002798 [Monosporascus sp. CRB-9-2]
MASGKATASGKDVAGGQPEGFDLEQIMKVFAKLSSKSESKKDTYLDWKYFDFKLTKLAAAVVANVKEGPMAVLTGLTKGTEMIKVLKRLYGAKGIDQKIDLWTQLQFVKWQKKTALDHVVDFKNLVRRCNEADMPVNASQQVTKFINSIWDRDDGTAWKGRMRGTLCQHPTITVNQVYDDFVAEFRGNDAKKGGGNAHNAKRQRWDKPAWNKDGQPLRVNRGEYGHMAKDRPKPKRSAECEASFIPAGLEDLYRTNGKIL